MFQKDAFTALLSALGAHWTGELPEARYLVDDSREAGEKDYFVLRDGTTVMTQERAQHLADQAVLAGISAIISHREVSVPAHVCLIRLDGTRQHLLELARGFYGPIPETLRLIAVTGTNGKTTTTYLIESAAQHLGLKVGVLGTISHRYPGYCEASENTTPGTLKLYRLLHAMVQARCDLVVMEVSSHAICQDRIAGLMYDIAIWNNLGIDHLDYHQTREAYGQAKQQLFSKYLVLSRKSGKNPVAIANAMDKAVMRLMHAANPDAWGGRLITFATDARVAGDVTIVTRAWKNHAWQGELQYRGESEEISLPLVGRYNVENAAAACSAFITLGHKLSDVACAMSKVSQIPGRMQVVREASPRVIVDFAHTPEALESALSAARETMAGGRLWVIFGCGGDRDASKRPVMAKYAQAKADVVVVTSDNPRTEDPQAIIRDIVSGLDMSRGVYVEADRRLAIALALKNAAAPEDVVLIAGKGHEDYQILGDTKKHFSDVEEVRRYYGLELET